MRRFNAHVFHDAMGAYVQYETADDGELVDAEEAIAEVDQFKKELNEQWAARIRLANELRELRAAIKELVE